MPVSKTEKILRKDWSNVLEICQALSPDWTVVKENDIQVWHTTALKGLFLESETMMDS